MVAKKKKAEAPENHERWLVSYADFMTLLFALFVVLYSFAMAKQSETRVLIQGFIESLGKIGLISLPAGSPVMQGGTGILEPESKTTPGTSQEKVLDTQAPAAAADPFNETIGASEKPSATEAWPHKTKEQDWATVTKPKLEQQLKSQIESQEIEVEQLGSQLVIRIGEKTLFPADSAFLQPQFIPLVNKVSDVLADIPGMVVVTGHTDNSQAPVELYRNNWELSVLRAATIVHTLLTNPKLDSRRVIAQGVADTQPRFANDTPAHRQANRRVEIVLSQGKAAEQALPLLPP
ncbi:MotB family protein [Aeromonas rivipollensis]|uniref:flagellar motor protein MotB n=1 Tax=Aeromonas rivipollensis TaxID=948519 RepID=UPI0027D992F8|nr:MotB family protein [uncultured Aeromonas sp.]MDU1142733.1 flagellar motor protein MotB [Aeromonas hydrophila]